MDSQSTLKSNIIGLPCRKVLRVAREVKENKEPGLLKSKHLCGLRAGEKGVKSICVRGNYPSCRNWIGPAGKIESSGVLGERGGRETCR